MGSRGFAAVLTLKSPGLYKCPDLHAWLVLWCREDFWALRPALSSTNMVTCPKCFIFPLSHLLCSLGWSQTHNPPASVSLPAHFKCFRSPILLEEKQVGGQ
jgi:hypothetical protein